MKYPAPQRRPGRADVSWISISVKKITTHILKQPHSCERAQLKAAELRSIRFRYCKGLRTFRNIKAAAASDSSPLVWELRWKGEDAHAEL